MLLAIVLYYLLALTAGQRKTYGRGVTRRDPFEVMLETLKANNNNLNEIPNEELNFPTTDGEPEFETPMIFSTTSASTNTSSESSTTTTTTSTARIGMSEASTQGAPMSTSVVVTCPPSLTASVVTTGLRGVYCNIKDPKPCPPCICPQPLDAATLTLDISSAITRFVEEELVNVFETSDEVRHNETVGALLSVRDILSLLIQEVTRLSSKKSLSPAPPGSFQRSGESSFPEDIALDSGSGNDPEGSGIGGRQRESREAVEDFGLVDSGFLSGSCREVLDLDLVRSLKRALSNSNSCLQLREVVLDYLLLGLCVLMILMLAWYNSLMSCFRRRYRRQYDDYVNVHGHIPMGAMAAVPNGIEEEEEEEEAPPAHGIANENLNLLPGGGANGNNANDNDGGSDGAEIDLRSNP